VVLDYIYVHNLVIFILNPNRYFLLLSLEWSHTIHARLSDWLLKIRLLLNLEFFLICTLHPLLLRVRPSANVIWLNLGVDKIVVFISHCG